MKKFGKILKDLRKEKGFTFQELSLLTNIPRATLCRLENNKSDIKGDQLIALSNFFQVSTDYLLGLEE